MQKNLEISQQYSNNKNCQPNYNNNKQQGLSVTTQLQLPLFTDKPFLLISFQRLHNLTPDILCKFTAHSARSFLAPAAFAIAADMSSPRLISASTRLLVDNSPNPDLFNPEATMKHL